MVTISICMIVKNEESVLGRILEQVKSVADEIILVDTGSTDRTKEIAGQYTDQIYDYEWNQDFAAARNFACAKARMDYWMWLDADDVLRKPEQEKLRTLKENMSSDVDVVMMLYQTGFDQEGKAVFSYYRERLLKNRAGFVWEGRVHEAVTPRGMIRYEPIVIEHRKKGKGDPNRNLNIYEQMIAGGEALDARHQFYYGRELYDHGRYQDAETALRGFLRNPGGWMENKIEACMQLAGCLERQGKDRERLRALLESFVYDVPRAEVCCEIGRYMMEHDAYQQAVYWYRQALAAEPKEESGAFVRKDCYGFLPAIQLCVCYDRLGEYERAWEYHKLSVSCKTEAPEVKLNARYFSEVRGYSGPGTRA